MSSSDCSECGKYNCPFREDDHWNCWVRRAKDIQEFALTNRETANAIDVESLKRLKSSMQVIVDETCDDAPRDLLHGLNEMIELLEANVEGL